MHVAKNHKICGSTATQVLNSDGKIAITPINVGMLPIPPTDAGRIRSKTRRTAMGEKHEWPLRGSVGRRLNDTVNRFLFSYRAENTLHRFREMKTTS